MAHAVHAARSGQRKFCADSERTEHREVLNAIAVRCARECIASQVLWPTPRRTAAPHV